MIILLSPTKTQKRHIEAEGASLIFNDAKDILLKEAKSLDKETIKQYFKTSDKLTDSTFANFQNYHEDSKAIFTYSGEAFKTLDPKSLSEAELRYLNEHLLIMSAFYGLVKPDNLISLYRLDFVQKFDLNLKDFWQDRITDYLNKQNKKLINLASNEFSGIIDQSKLKVDMINIHFLNEKDGKLRVVSPHAKKARGSFARHLIINKFPDLEDISVEGYKFSHQEDLDYFYIKKES